MMEHDTPVPQSDIPTIPDNSPPAYRPVRLEELERLQSDNLALMQDNLMLRKRAAQKVFVELEDEQTRLNMLSRNFLRNVAAARKLNPNDLFITPNGVVTTVPSTEE